MSLKLLFSPRIWIAFLTLSRIVGGAQAADGTQSDFSWQDPDKRWCGMSCVFSKMNENLSTQALYAVGKIDWIEKALLDPAERGGLSEDSFLTKHLGPFCMTKTKEAPRACFERYKKVNILYLTKIEAQIASNKAKIIDLNDTREITAPYPGAPRLAPLRVAASAAYSVEKKPQVPSPPTYEELQKQYNDQSTRMRLTATERYLQWMDALPQEPSRDEFLKFKTVQLPSGERIDVLDKSCGVGGGKTCIDENNYKRAVERYRVTLKELEPDMKAMREEADTFKPVRALEASEDGVGPGSAEVYNKTRQAIVSVSNKSISETRDFAPRVVSFAGKGDSRGPASPVGQEQVLEPVKNSAGNYNGVNDVHVSMSVDGLDGEIDRITKSEKAKSQPGSAP